MERVRYSVQDRIAWITLARPEALNAIDRLMDRELAEVWDAFASDAQADVAIVHGEGRAFCAGMDVKTYLPECATATFGDLRDKVHLGLAGGITRGKHRIHKPLIAAVQGSAVGAGFELALACDIRLASEDAMFGVFEVRHGLHQGDGGLVRLLAVAGLGVALELTLTGRPVQADEALRLGLVSAVVQPGELLDRAEAIALKILGNSQDAIRSAKETLLDLVGRSLDDALRLEAINGYTSFRSGDELFARLRTSIR